MKHLAFITAFEAGELSHDEIVEGFQLMIDDGTVWDLQGSYQRIAIDMIDTGKCQGWLSRAS